MTGIWADWPDGQVGQPFRPWHLIVALGNISYSHYLSNEILD